MKHDDELFIKTFILLGHIIKGSDNPVKKTQEVYEEFKDICLT